MGFKDVTDAIPYNLQFGQNLQGIWRIKECSRFVHKMFNLNKEFSREMPKSIILEQTKAWMNIQKTLKLNASRCTWKPIARQNKRQLKRANPHLMHLWVLSNVTLPTETNRIKFYLFWLTWYTKMIAMSITSSWTIKPHYLWSIKKNLRICLDENRRITQYSNTTCHTLLLASIINSLLLLYWFVSVYLALLFFNQTVSRPPNHSNCPFIAGGRFASSDRNLTKPSLGWTLPSTLLSSLFGFSECVLIRISFLYFSTSPSLFYSIHLLIQTKLPQIISQYVRDKIVVIFIQLCIMYYINSQWIK